jgi:hypothetical protein
LDGCSNMPDEETDHYYGFEDVGQYYGFGDGEVLLRHLGKIRDECMRYEYLCARKRFRRFPERQPRHVRFPRKHWGMTFKGWVGAGKARSNQPAVATKVVPDTLSVPAVATFDVIVVAVPNTW